MRKGRATAVRFKISDLHGSLTQEPFVDIETGETRYINRLQLPNSRVISRVRFLGIVTEKISGTTGNFVQLRLEDGSGAILLKSWDNILNNYEEGATIEIVGILRLSKGEGTERNWFVQPEAITPVKEADRETIHRLEALRPIDVDEPIGTETSTFDPKELKTNLENLIKNLDKDNKGVSYEELRSKYPQTSENEFEDIIFELLMEGKISEPRPERYRYVQD